MALLNSFAASEQIFNAEKIKAIWNPQSKEFVNDAAINLAEQLNMEVLKRLKPQELIASLPFAPMGICLIPAEILTTIVVMAFLTGLEHAEKFQETSQLEEMFKL